jgi:RNA polymerase sigma-70 factor (ECF subfamily)
MARNPDSETSLTLLARLRDTPADQSAWGQFVARYGGKIYGWCRHWELQGADAEDVTQEVLLKLSSKMQDFRYDRSGSFRAWLKTLTHHAWQDFVTSRRRAGEADGGSAIRDVLQTVEAREDLLARLGEEFDRELLDAATARVRQRVQPHTWDAFRLTALEGLSGAEAGKQLGMKVATVFVAKSKVQRMLQEEMQRLEGGDPGQSEDTL